MKTTILLLVLLSVPALADPSVKADGSEKRSALESYLQKIQVQDVTIQNLGALFTLRTNAPNAEIQAMVTRACGAGLLHIGKSDTYQKSVRDKIPEVADFERLLLAFCGSCGGKGKTTGACRKCSGSGKCTVRSCYGGRIATVSLDNRDDGRTIACAACQGGICVGCRGRGQLTGECPKCGGRGGVFSASAALLQHKKEVEKAIVAFETMRRAEIAEIKRQETENKRKLAEEDFAAKMREAKIVATHEAAVAEGRALGEERARQEAITMREDAERKRRADEAAKYAELDKGYLESVVIIQGTRGLGTGFLCDFKGTKTLLSNAHVLVGNSLTGDDALKLHSINAGDIPYKRIRVHKSRDIVAYEIAAADNLKFLGVYLGTYNNQEEVAVFGNSDGKRVATTLRGKMQGIGPDNIEVSAQFVPGNSGSPIIAYPYQAVVGIATYAIANPQGDWTIRGTRFENVRRFGVRLDNVEWSDFIEIDTAEYGRALEVFDVITDFANEILESIQPNQYYRASGNIRTQAENLLRQYRATPEWMRRYADDAALAAYICVKILEN